ncbi:snaclec subunit B-like [Pecten maximus]|uniref:snaclec subunit B-like n=1 Tax=Pecten maximus TaxID=6579 RepID=UPI0014586C8C|nr:snaclec subunit B-like [Pecten maximus]
MFLLEIVLLALLLVLFSQGFLEVPSNDRYPITRQDFLHIKLPTRYQCLELCVTFKLCRSLHFNHKDGICRLNSDDKDRQTIWNTGYRYFLISRKDIPEDIGGACSGNTCAIDEKCVPAGLAYFCVKHEYSTVKCPPDWGHRGDLCFYLFLESKTWTEAKDYCASMGAELLRLNWQNEKSHRVWIAFQLTKSRKRPKVGKVWTDLQNTPDVRRWLTISDSATNGSDLCLGLKYEEMRKRVSLKSWEAVSCNEKNPFACQHWSPDHWQ